jgi:hypothetical protein
MLYLFSGFDRVRVGAMPLIMLELFESECSSIPPPLTCLGPSSPDSMLSEKESEVFDMGNAGSMLDMPRLIEVEVVDEEEIEGGIDSGDGDAPEPSTPPRRENCISCDPRSEPGPEPVRTGDSDGSGPEEERRGGIGIGGRGRDGPKAVSGGVAEGGARGPESMEPHGSAELADRMPPSGSPLLLPIPRNAPPFAVLPFPPPLLALPICGPHVLLPIPPKGIEVALFAVEEPAEEAEAGAGPGGGAGGTTENFGTKGLAPADSSRELSTYLGGDGDRFMSLSLSSVGSRVLVLPEKLLP